MLRFTLLTASLFLAVSTPAVADAVQEKLRDQAERSADDNAKMICKRFNETGSLVRSYRVCKTKFEWQRERDNLRNLGTTASCGAEGGRC